MKNRPVTFTPAAARRIASAVSRVENGRQVTPGRKLKYMADEGGDAIRLCKSGSSKWTKGSARTVDVWEDGEPGDESQSTGETVEAYNRYADIPANTFCSVARHGNGSWYVISAEMIYRDVITGIELQSDKILFTRTRIWTIEDQTEIDPIELPVESCT